MISKRGDLENNALSVIVAVVCILLLLFGIVQLYRAASNSQERSAQRIATMLEQKIGAIQPGSSSTLTIQGFTDAKSWSITGWNLDDRTRPDKCALEACVCVCKGLTGADCQTQGYCRTLGSNSIFVRTYVTDASLIRAGVYEGVTLEYVLRNHISLKPNLLQVFIEVNSTAVQISEYIRGPYQVFLREDGSVGSVQTLEGELISL